MSHDLNNLSLNPFPEYILNPPADIDKGARGLLQYSTNSIPHCRPT